MRRIIAAFMLACCMCCMRPWSAYAEGPMDAGLQSMQGQMEEMKKMLGKFESLLQEQNQRIAALEKNNQELSSRLEEKLGFPSAQRIPPSAPIEVSKPKQGLLGQGWNPDMAVVGDMVATLSDQSVDTRGNDRFAVREMELVFGSYLDPYSRFDATLTLADFETMDIEEAYITHYGLPYGIKGELGRFHPRIGKAATVHREVLETTDEPLVVQRYFGVEGYFRSGADLSKTFDLPWDITGEITAGVLEGGVGEGGETFGDARRRPTLFSHLKTYKDITDMSNVEVGVTHMAGSKSERDRFDVNVIGLDGTWNYYVTPSNKLKWQSEMYLQNRKSSSTFDADGEFVRFSQYPWGFYSLLDYRLSPHWEVGARADAVEPVDNLSGNRLMDTGWCAYLTFHQSEFARWRFQFEHTDFAAGGDDNAVFLQGTFAIGQHKHKLM